MSPQAKVRHLIVSPSYLYDVKTNGLFDNRYKYTLYELFMLLFTLTNFIITYFCNCREVRNDRNNGTEMREREFPD